MKYTKNEIRYLVYKRDKFRCKICNTKIRTVVKRITYKKYMATVHPIIPIINGGVYMPHNLITVCYSCNKYKGGWEHYYKWCKGISLLRLTKSAKKRLRDIASSKKQKLIKKYGKYCYLCNVELTTSNPNDKIRETDMTIDHVKPISKGGKSNIENLRLCCHKCNSNKGNSHAKKSRANTSR